MTDPSEDAAGTVRRDPQGRLWMRLVSPVQYPGASEPWAWEFDGASLLLRLGDSQVRDFPVVAVPPGPAGKPDWRAVVTDFCAERAQYITSIENCHPENYADYHRWQGGAEARRQLAERLGLPVAWPAGHRGGRS